MASQNRFADLDEEPKTKARPQKKQPVVETPAAAPVETPRPRTEGGHGGRGRGRGGAGRGRGGHGGENRESSEGGRAPKRQFDRKSRDGIKSVPAKGGAGAGNWGDEQVDQQWNAEAVNAFTDDAVDPAAAPAAAEGEAAPAEIKEEVPAEPEEPPTKDLAQFMAEKEAKRVKMENTGRRNRNQGFTGKAVVVAETSAAAPEAKSARPAAARKTISMDEFAPAPERRERSYDEERPRREYNDGERPAYRGRGEGRGGRGEFRGRGRGQGRGRGGPARGGKPQAINLKDEAAFPKM